MSSIKTSMYEINYQTTTYFHAYPALFPLGNDNKHIKYSRSAALAIEVGWIMFSCLKELKKDQVSIKVFQTIEKIQQSNKLAKKKNII